MEETKELMHEDFQHVDVSQKTDTTDSDESTSLSTDNLSQTPINVLTTTANVLTPHPALLIPPYEYPRDSDVGTSLSTDKLPQTLTNVLTTTEKVVTPPPVLPIPPCEYSANTVNVENDANDKQSVLNVDGSIFDAQALASTDESPKPFIKLTKPLLYAVGAGLSALAIMGGLLFVRGKVRRS